MDDITKMTEEEILQKKREYKRIHAEDAYSRATRKANKARSQKNFHNSEQSIPLIQKKAQQLDTMLNLHSTSSLSSPTTQKLSHSMDSDDSTITITSDDNDTDTDDINEHQSQPSLSVDDIEKLSRDVEPDMPGAIVVRPDGPRKATAGTEPLPVLARPKYKAEDISPFSVYYVNYYSLMTLEQFHLYKNLRKDNATIAETFALNLLDDALNGLTKDERYFAKKTYWDLQKTIYRKNQQKSNNPQTGVKGSILDRIMDDIKPAEILDTPNEAC